MPARNKFCCGVIVSLLFKKDIQIARKSQYNFRLSYIPKSKAGRKLIPFMHSLKKS